MSGELDEVYKRMSSAEPSERKRSHKRKTFSKKPKHLYESLEMYGKSQKASDAIVCLEQLPQESPKASQQLHIDEHESGMDMHDS